MEPSVHVIAPAELTEPGGVREVCRLAWSEPVGMETSPYNVNVRCPLKRDPTAEVTEGQLTISPER